MILGPDGKPLASAKASYDATTLKELDNRFANANGSSADVTDSLSTRTTLRNRARFEVRNNSYATGLLKRLCFEIVGSGPRPSITAANDKAANEVEKRFIDYLWATDSVTGLHQAFFGHIQDGESFGQFQPDRTIKDTPIRLRWYEPDQFSDGLSGIYNGYSGQQPPVDGIEFDDFGNVKSYKKLKHHPGGNAIGFSSRPDTIPASEVVHLFFPSRPGQHRGVSQLAPCLPLFIQMRQYTQSVLDAAETASDLAALMTTDNPNLDFASVGSEAMVIPIRRKSIVNLPDGYDVKQMKSEQPVTSFSEFKREILAEIYNCVLVPYSTGAADSSDQNFASGKLDANGFYRAIDSIRRILLERKILNRLFSRWLEFAALNRWFPSNLGPIDMLRWFYDRREPLDPQKEAGAVKSLSEQDLLNEEAYAASHGHSLDDWYAMKKRVAEAKARHGINTEVTTNGQ